MEHEVRDSNKKDKEVRVHEDDMTCKECLSDMRWEFVNSITTAVKINIDEYYKHRDKEIEDLKGTNSTFKVWLISITIAIVFIIISQGFILSIISKKF